MDINNPQRSGEINDKELKAMALVVIAKKTLKKLTPNDIANIINDAYEKAEDMSAYLIDQFPQYKDETISAFQKFIWGNQYWRMNNLYTIKVKKAEDDDSGEMKMKFKMNAVQEELFHGMHHKNVILKARQFGITTFWQIFAIDCILFNKNMACGVIAQTREDGATIFRDKVKFAYDNLIDTLKDARPILKSDANELIVDFNGVAGSNTSRIKVSTSLRSGTYQLLHISELAKLCAIRPDKAEEVKTGAFPTVPESGIIAIESTAEGNTGLFKDIVDEAQETKKKCERDKRPLHPKEWKLFFFPWWRHTDYQTSTLGIEIKTHVKDYFRRLLADPYIMENMKGTFSDRQVAWYQLESAQQGDKMLREYPSTPTECFMQAVEGTYFEKEMSSAEKEGRVGLYKYDPNIPVHTSWDIGFSDYTCIVFFQIEGLEVRVIDYFEDCNKGMSFYLKQLKEYPWSRNYGGHYTPWDLNQREWTTGLAKRTTALQHGVEFIPLSKCKNKHEEHEEARRRFPFICFHAPNTEILRTHIQLYRRRWDSTVGMWKDKPLHDEHSHGTDAFLIMCRAIEIIKNGGIISHVQEVANEIQATDYLW